MTRNVAKRNRRASVLGVSVALSVPLLLAACSSDTTSDSASVSPATGTVAQTGGAAGSPSAPADASASAAAAGDQATPKPTGGIPLADTKWALTGVNWTSDDVTGFKINMEFTADSVSGFAGVNRFNGGYESTTDGTLKFGTLATTLMAGDEKSMKMESEYLAALNKVTNYSASDQRLDLFSGKDLILTYAKAS